MDLLLLPWLPIVTFVKLFKEGLGENAFSHSSAPALKSRVWLSCAFVISTLDNPPIGIWPVNTWLIHLLVFPLYCNTSPSVMGYWSATSLSVATEPPEFIIKVGLTLLPEISLL